MCGDADFAYSCALSEALQQRGMLASLCASSFEAEADLVERYPHAEAAIATLRRDRGVELHCGVDARALCHHFDGREFDRIVFNLPQAPVEPGSRNKIQRHRALLCDFCVSAEQALAAHGELYITLLAGQGGTCLDPIQRPLGDTWMLQAAAARAGMLLRAATPVDVGALGYTPTGRRVNQRITPSRLARGLVVHSLSREDEPAATAPCEIRWCYLNTFHAEVGLDAGTRVGAGAGAAEGAKAVPETAPEGALHEWALDALGPAAHALPTAPVLLRTRRLEGERHALTYRFIYRSARLALSRERVHRANAAACEAIANAAGMRWTLGFPVKGEPKPELATHQ